MTASVIRLFPGRWLRSQLSGRSVRDKLHLQLLLSEPHLLLPRRRLLLLQRRSGLFTNYFTASTTFFFTKHLSSEHLFYSTTVQVYSSNIEQAILRVQYQAKRRSWDKLNINLVCLYLHLYLTQCLYFKIALFSGNKKNSSGGFQNVQGRLTATMENIKKITQGWN